jgi:pyruvate/2-oxoglutarate dehydrogenase complex dihydrolipoamide dehydrogenase (E3) component
VARDAVVLGVGSKAQFPPIPGLTEAAAWSNREITTAKEVPGRLLVLGGGVVGVEMAQAWSWLGSKVTVLEAADRLVAHEEPVASDAVRAGLEEAGVQIELGVKASAVSRQGEEVTVELDDGRTFTADRLLVAVGRHPLTDELGLETVGLEPGGYVVVDDHLRVEGLPWLYAVGDVNGRSLLTHSGKYQARIAADVILGEEAVAWADLEQAPRVIFTEPQVAAVGLTVEKAEAQELEVHVIDLVTNGTAGGSFYGRGTKGTTRFVVDVAREILLGVTFVGIDIQDFVQAATFAVVAEIPLWMLAHGTAAFPTRSEIWLKFIEAYEKDRGRSLHTVR